MKYGKITALAAVIIITNICTYIYSTGTDLSAFLSEDNKNNAASYESSSSSGLNTSVLTSANEISALSSGNTDVDASSDAFDLSAYPEMSGNDAENSDSYYRNAANRAILKAEQTGYYFSSYTDEEQTLYIELLDAILNFKNDVLLTTTNSNMIDGVFQGVLSDHPEIFYLNGYTYKHTKGSDSLLFSATYTMGREEIEEMNRQLEAQAAEYLKDIPQNDEFAIVKYLYDMIIVNTTYTLDAKDNQNIQSVLLYGSSVCNGYAKTMKYLLDKAGVESVIAYGTVEDGSRHAWNIVKIDNEWYHVDATWGDSVFQSINDDGTEQKFINYDYLCATTADILKTHTIDTDVQMPLCTSIKNNYYNRAGAYFTDVNIDQLNELFANAYLNGNNTVMIKANSVITFAKLYSYLIEEQNIFHFCLTSTSITYTVNESLNSFVIWL